MPKHSSAVIKAKMEKLKADLKEAEKRDAERIGRIAVKAGLHEVNFDEADLLRMLKEYAARFRNKPESKNTPHQTMDHKA